MPTNPPFPQEVQALKDDPSKWCACVSECRFAESEIEGRAKAGCIRHFNPGEEWLLRRKVLRAINGVASWLAAPGQIAPTRGTLESLTSLLRQIDEALVDAHDTHALNDRLGALLTRIANALRGEPAQSYLHSWHDLPERAAALASLPDQPSSARPEEERTQSWAVTVERNGEQVVTLASNCLAGRDLTPEDEHVVRMAAEHLLSFVGASSRPSVAEMEQEIAALRRAGARRNCHELRTVVADTAARLEAALARLAAERPEQCECHACTMIRRESPPASAQDEPKEA